MVWGVGVRGRGAKGVYKIVGGVGEGEGEGMGERVTWRECVCFVHSIEDNGFALPFALLLLFACSCR